MINCFQVIYDKLLSSFAFKIKLRRYTQARTAAASGWALYRRILVVHATHRQRMELKETEARRQAAAH
jgi:hypothetical protein